MRPFTQQVGHLHRSFFRNRYVKAIASREYPAADPTRFVTSASSFQTLLQDGTRILQRIAG